MRPCDPNKPSVDPRRAAREEGADAIARLLRGAGYVIKRKTLNDLLVALDLAMPLLAAGPAGTGKTSLVEALAEGCNVPLYEVTGHPGQEARDVIGAWNRRAQDRAEDAAIAAGLGLEEAGHRRWADEYFECGEVLDAYREAARAAEAGDPPPALLIDEVEKLDAGIQHTLLQPLARGFAAAPKLKGVIGVADPMLAPVVVMTTNDLKKLGEPLRARVPQASAYLIGAAAKLLHKIRTGMDEITHKPGIRGAVLLLRAMSRHGVERVTRRTLEPYLGCLARDGEDEKNLYAALATLELAANRSHAVIDETVRLEFEKARLRLCGERRWPHERGVQRTVGLCRRRGRAARRRIFAHQRIGATDRGGRAANPDRAKQRQQSVASGARGAVCGHARRDGWRDGDDSRALARGFGACRRGGMACGHAKERDRGGALRKLEAMGMLPAGAVIAADKGNALATPYGALIFHYRAAPIGVEALSLGRDKAAGPALIVRLAADMPGGDALKVWASTRLDNVQLPRPFADESEVIAAGWQAEKLSASQ